MSNDVVDIPDDAPQAQREAWRIASRLSTIVPAGWTVVGGQMVQFHAWRAGRIPVRTTTDLDAGIAARAFPGAFTALSGALQDLGLRPHLHPTGVEHRWWRALDDGSRVQVDLLLPTALGERSRLSANNRPGVSSRGIQWAADLSRSWRMRIDGVVSAVPVPSLMGAVLAKASALLNSSDADPARHLTDLEFLAGLATLDDLSERLTPRQATRVLDAVSRMDAGQVPVVRLRMAMQRHLRGGGIG